MQLKMSCHNIYMGGQQQQCGNTQQLQTATPGFLVVDNLTVPPTPTPRGWTREGLDTGGAGVPPLCITEPALRHHLSMKGNGSRSGNRFPRIVSCPVCALLTLATVCRMLFASDLQLRLVPGNLDLGHNAVGAEPVLERLKLRRLNNCVQTKKTPRLSHSPMVNAALFAKSLQRGHPSGLENTIVARQIGALMLSRARCVPHKS